jgi:hypothetical protein
MEFIGNQIKSFERTKKAAKRPGQSGAAERNQG